MKNVVRGSKYQPISIHLLSEVPMRVWCISQQKIIYRNKFNNNHNNLTRQEHDNNFQNQNFNITLALCIYRRVLWWLVCPPLVCVAISLFDWFGTHASLFIYLRMFLWRPLIGDSRHNLIWKLNVFKRRLSFLRVLMLNTSSWEVKRRDGQEYASSWLISKVKLIGFLFT